MLNSVPSFARGLPLLLVDHDPTSLASTRSLLGRYFFKVTGTELPSVALSIIQEKKSWFKLVMANIDKINDENFSILCELMKEEIPVILMSANQHKNTAGRSLAVGASYFLYKPLAPENLKVLWQHAFRRRMIVPTEKRNTRSVKSQGKEVLRKEHSPDKKIDKATRTQEASVDQLRKKRGHIAEGDQVDERCAEKPKVGKSRFAPLNVKGKGTTLEAGAKRSNDGKDNEREHERPRIDSERVDSNHVSEEGWNTNYTEDDSIGTSLSGRRRMRQAVWSPELHPNFTAALSALGDDTRPKTILKTMDVPYLNHHQVTSHLQKHKNQVQRLCNIASASNVPSDGQSDSSNRSVEPHQQPDTHASVSGQVGQASIDFRSGGSADTSQQYFLPSPQLSFNSSSPIPNQVPQQAQNQYPQLSDFPANPSEQSSQSSHCEKLHNGSQASSHNLNYPGEHSNLSNDNLNVNQGLNGNEESTYQVPWTDLPNIHSINPVVDPTAFASLSMPPRVEGSMVLPEPFSRLQNQTMSLTAVTDNAAPTVSPQVGVEDNIITGLAEIFRPLQKQHLWTELCDSSDLVDLQHHPQFDSLLDEVDTPSVPPELGREINYYTEFASLISPQQTSNNLLPSQGNQYEAMNKGLTQSLAGSNLVPSQENQYNVMDQGLDLVAEVEPQPQACFMNQSLTSDNPAPSQENQYHVMNKGLDLILEAEPQPQAWFMNQPLNSDNPAPSQENQYHFMNQGLDLVPEAEPQPQAWFMNQSLTSDNPVHFQQNSYHVMNQGLDLVPEAEPQPQAWFMNQSLTGDNLMSSQDNPQYVMNQELNLEVDPHLKAWFMNQTQTGDNPVTCQENRCHVMNQGLDLVAEAEPQPQAWFMNQTQTSDNLVPSPENQHYVMNQGLNLHTEPQPEAWYINQSQTSDNPLTCQENQWDVMNQGLDLVAEVERQPQAGFMNQSLTGDNLMPSSENQHRVMNQGLNVEVEAQPEARFTNQTLTDYNPVTSQENQYYVMSQGSDLFAEVELQPQAQACFMKQPQSNYDVPLRIDGMEDLRDLLDEPMLDEINHFSEWLADILRGNDNPIIG